MRDAQVEDPQELADILGANGLERAPWYRPDMAERINAEAYRLMAVHGPALGEVAHINVVFNDPSVMGPWMEATADDMGQSYADTVRSLGTTADGHVVWPSNRAGLADEWRRMGSGRMADVLAQAPPAGHVYLVVHWPHPTGPRCAVVAVMVMFATSAAGSA